MKNLTILLFVGVVLNYLISFFGFNETNFKSLKMNSTCIDTLYNPPSGFWVNKDQYYLDDTGNYSECKKQYLNPYIFYDFNFSTLSLENNDTIRIFTENECCVYEKQFEFTEENNGDTTFYSVSGNFQLEYISNAQINSSEWEMIFYMSGFSDPDLSFWGEIKTPLGKGVKNVKINFIRNGETTYCYTNNHGRCNTSSISSGEVLIIPTKNGNVEEGLTTRDQIAILKHLTGIEEFTSPYELIAGDIDNSGEITVSDLVELRNIILNISEEFENNESWKFIPKCHEFSSEMNPLIDDYPNSLTLDYPFKMSRFIGIKIGDVNFSYE